MRVSRCMLAAVTVLVVAGLASPVARADSVSFSVVSGVFGSTGTNSALYRSGNAGSVIAFARSTNVFSFDLSDGESKWVPSFGTFAVLGVGRSSINVDDTFTLTLEVFQPASGTGSRTATASGKLKAGDSGKDLTISFPGTLNIPQFTLPNVSFDFRPVTLSEAQGENVGSLAGSATLHAAPRIPPPGPTPPPASTPAGVPLPAPVWAGIALLGGVALTRFFGRKAGGTPQV